MDRREFLQTLATRTAAATALGIAAGCASQELGVETPCLPLLPRTHRSLR